MEFLAALKRRPAVIGDHCYPPERLQAMWRLEGFNEHRPCYARHAQSLLILLGFGPPTETWPTPNCRIDHAWAACIHAVPGPSCAEVRQIARTRSLADLAA